MKYALVTGVSSGIGYEITKKFLDKQLYVFGSVRKEEDKHRLENEFTTNFEALVFDVTNERAIDNAINYIEQKVGAKGLSLLVNNAGMAEFGPIEHLNLEDFRNQLEVNLLSPIAITQKLLPILGTNKFKTKNKGRIIMISSTSGKFTRPILGPYSASKHALEAISDAWRRELRYMHQIELVVVQPGPIKTNIWNKAKEKENKFKNTRYGKITEGLNDAVEKIEKIAIHPKKVANVVWKAYCTKKPRARYLIAPVQWYFWLLLHIIPDGIQDKMLIKELKKLDQQ